MLTKQARDILKILIDLTGGTDKNVTYVFGQPQFCLWDDSSSTRDFSKYDPEINSIMEALADAGAIKPTGNHVFHLTHLGIHYKQIQWLERREKWRERLWGYVFGVLTGVTITVVLERVLPALLP